MSSSSTDSIAPSKVWATLNDDLQTRVLRLLAQLAFNLLVAQTQPPIKKEAFDAHSSVQSQTPA
jgi:hypothetical protein